jgi:hypothetical protein
MDGSRFDNLTRTMNASATRRRFGGLLAALTSMVTLPKPARAGCGRTGCICSADSHCYDGLICCIPGDFDGWADGLCTVPGLCACTSEGCTCYPHTETPCDPGLTCTATNTPSAGTCQPTDIPAGACVAWGEWCPDWCAPGSDCDGCCGGYCGVGGSCDERICTASGCRCEYGQPGACDPGLTCEAVQAPLGSDLPGGICM